MTKESDNLLHDYTVLRSLMWQWLAAALSFIATQGQFLVSSRSYYVNQDDTRQVLEQNYNCIPDINTVLATVNLAEWKRFESALLNTKAGSDRLYMIVYSGRTGSTLRPIDVAERFLHPHVHANESGVCSLTIPTRDEFNITFSKFMTSLTQEYQAWCDSLYISGVTLESAEALKLNDELAIERVSNDELLSILQHDAPLNSTTIMKYMNAENCCLCIRRRVHLQVYTRDNSDFLRRPLFTEYEETDALFNSVLEALALTGMGHVRSIAHTSQALGLFIGSGIGHRYVPSDTLGGHSCHVIDAYNAAEIIATLSSILKIHQQRSPFELPLRYVLNGTRRNASTEKIIDLAIAAESMLIGKGDSQLSYRFALRGAMLLSKDPEKRLRLFHVLKAAYDARSTIVHGGKHDDSKRFKLAEQRITLETLIAQFEPLVREILLVLISLNPLAPPSESAWTAFELGGALVIDSTAKLSK